MYVNNEAMHQSFPCASICLSIHVSCIPVYMNCAMRYSPTLYSNKVTLIRRLVQTVCGELILIDLSCMWPYGAVLLSITVLREFL